MIVAVVGNSPKYKKSDVNKALEKLEKCYDLDHDPRTEQYKKDRLEQFQRSSEYEDKYLVMIDEFSSIESISFRFSSLNKNSMVIFLISDRVTIFGESLD